MHLLPFQCTLKYTGDDALIRVFTSPTREVTRDDGSAQIRAIVLDGTANEIMSSLPPYHRPALTVYGADRTA